MEWKEKCQELIKERIIDFEPDEKLIDVALENTMQSIIETLESLQKYNVNEIVMIYDEYCNGLVMLELTKFGDTVEDALFYILENVLDVKEQRCDFLFLSKTGNSLVSKLFLTWLLP